MTKIIVLQNTNRAPGKRCSLAAPRGPAQLLAYKQYAELILRLQCMLQNLVLAREDHRT